MGLIESYARIRPAIVAIVDRVVFSPDGSTPHFADIIGTGFFVDESGIVVTNRHIVDALLELPRHPETGRRTGGILAFDSPRPTATGHRLPTALLEIDNLTACNKKIDTPGWYGAEVLDIGFIQVKATGTPALRLAREAGSVVAGRMIGTAGFPMGTDGLVFFADSESRTRLRQVGPTLRQGIIASLIPYDVPLPHGFTIDVMVQGGASGSPVFAVDDAGVLGMVASGPESVNSTVCEPASLIAENLDIYKGINRADLSSFMKLQHQFSQPTVSHDEAWRKLKKNLEI